MGFSGRRSLSHCVSLSGAPLFPSACYACYSEESTVRIYRYINRCISFRFTSAIKFPSVHVSYQTKSNKISNEPNRTLCNERVQCSSAIERNRTQNVCVSSMPERNQIIERTRFKPYNDCSFSALATEKWNPSVNFWSVFPSLFFSVSRQ